MHTYTRLLYQIIFHTKRNEKTLLKANREEMYSYMASIINNQKSFTYEIGGTSNHVHIITRIHPTIVISNLVKDIKLSTSKMIKSRNLFPHFEGWQQGYSIFSYSKEQIDILLDVAKRIMDLLRDIEEKVFITTEHFRFPLSDSIAQKVRRRTTFSKAVLGIRPEDITIGQGEIPGEVYAVEPLGRDTLVTLRIGKAEVKVLGPPRFKATIGEEERVAFSDERIQFFDKATGRSLLL